MSDLPTVSTVAFVRYNLLLSIHHFYICVRLGDFLVLGWAHSIFYITIHCKDFYMYNIIDIYILVCCFRFLFWSFLLNWGVLMLLGFCCWILLLVSGFVFVCACWLFCFCGFCYVELVMCFVFVLFLDFFGIWYRVGAMRWTGVCPSVGYIPLLITGSGPLYRGYGKSYPF